MYIYIYIYINDLQLSRLDIRSQVNKEYISSKNNNKSIQLCQDDQNKYD